MSYFYTPAQVIALLRHHWGKEGKLAPLKDLALKDLGSLRRLGDWWKGDIPSDKKKEGLVKEVRREIKLLWDWNVEEELRHILSLASREPPPKEEELRHILSLTSRELPPKPKVKDEEQQDEEQQDEEQQDEEQQDEGLHSVAPSMYRHVRELRSLEGDGQVSSEVWGLAILTYTFLKLSINKVLPDDQDPDPMFMQSEIYASFRMVSERLLSFADSVPKENQGLWLTFLTFNVKQNLLSVEWNGTIRKQRTSLRTKAQFEDYLLDLLKYLNRYERDVPAVHNSLCYASRMNLREYFAELRESYRIALGREPDWTDRKEFDDDFDNFRQWLATLLSPGI